jgi:peptidoglycan/xylan/chitin deacetylase (PgdA/CDA1 family)
VLGTSGRDLVKDARTPSGIRKTMIKIRWFGSWRTLALAALAVLCAVPALGQSRTVAITVDDLPYAAGGVRPNLSPAAAPEARAVNRAILAALLRHHVPATGFVIGRGVDQLGATGPRLLRRWIAAGFDLGNHSYSHPDIDKLDLAAIEDEIVKDEASFLPLMRAAHRGTRFIRFPYNHTGDTQAKHDAIAAFIAARGYTMAVCTIDNEDFAFNDAYLAALSRHDAAAAGRIRQAYLDYTGIEIDYYAGLNKQVFGYEPPQVMLLHDNRLNADVMDQVLELFERRGYTFASLQQAESDPAYGTPDTFATPFGMMWGYRWARERKVHVDGSLEQEPPSWVTNYAAAPPAR